MKLRNKEVNIFSMSALDLFASGMGAFILLAVISLPFFANTSPSPPAEPKVCPEVTPCPKTPEPPKPLPVGVRKIEHVDLVMVLDVTGSMKSVINSLKNEVVGIGSLLDFFAESAAMRIVVFGDESFDNPVSTFPLTSTKNIATLQRQIDALEVDYGKGSGRNNTTGESVFAGVEAATRTPWRSTSVKRIIVLITDDNPHPGEFSLLENQVAQFVRGKKNYSVSVRLLGSQGDRVNYYKNIAQLGKGKFLDSGSLTSSVIKSLFPEPPK